MGLQSLGYGSMQLLIFKSAMQISIAVPFSMIQWDAASSSRCPLRCSFSELALKIKAMDCKLWCFVLFRGIFGAITSVVYFEAIAHLPIGDAMALYSLYPIPTVFVAFIALRERVSIHYVVALLLSVAGTVILIHPAFVFGDDLGEDHHKETMTGYIAAILSAVLMSGVFIFIRLAKAAPPTVLIVAQGISCIVEGVVIGLWLQSFYGLHSVADYVCLCSIGVIGFGAQWGLTKLSHFGKMKAGVFHGLNLNMHSGHHKCYQLHWHRY